MKSTIELFRYLYTHLPPLFPKETAAKMKHALEHLESDPSATLEQAEETMIEFGYEAWPWNRAYREFLNLTEGKLGEHFLLPLLSAGLVEKYMDFKSGGGDLRVLHSGNPAQFFNSDERTELCTALVDMRQQLRKYTDSTVTGLEKEKYLKRVDEFTKVLVDIRIKLDALRDLAAHESEHPNLAAEIRERVRMFEQGLCLLAPEPDYTAVCESAEFFAGRHNDLGRMRGIHTPVNIDFYAE